MILINLNIIECCFNNYEFILNLSIHVESLFKICSLKLKANENKRRSARGGKRTKYVDEAISNADLILPPTEEELAADAAADAAQAASNSNIVLTSGETLVIDKILGCRLFKRKTMSKKARVRKLKKVPVPGEVDALMTDLLDQTEAILAGGDVLPAGVDLSEIAELTSRALELPSGDSDSEYEASEWEEDGGEIEVEEFYVKYKSFSYLHCEWRTRDELVVSDKRIDQKIKRYRLKKSQEIR